MKTQSLREFEIQLQAAAAGHRYDEVVRLAAEYGEATKAYVSSLPRHDLRALQAAGNYGAALTRALVILQASRSACCAELRRVTTAVRYAHRQEQTTASSAVCVQG